jgi:cardiolipin synthase
MSPFDLQSEHGAGIDAPVRRSLHPCLPELIEGRDGESFTVFTEGDLLYESMLAAIKDAKINIRLETYILAGDEIGWRFGEALVNKVRQGLSVRLIVDAAGVMLWGSQALVRFMQQQGVTLELFHRWHWRKPLRYNRRDHRKLLVIDDEILYLGGFNLHRENSRSLVGDGRWRDTHVKVNGGLAREAAALFDIVWRKKKYWQRRSGPTISALVPNHNHVCRQDLHSLFTDSFEAAAKTIYVTTPYFVPDHRTQRSLKVAAQRGIDVRLLLPAKNDVWLAQWASHAAYAELLFAGVRIFEYLPRVLHAKTAVVDGSWATLGTANLDYRSLFLNFEVNLVTRDIHLCHELQNCFTQDLAQAEEISKHDWAKRPWNRHVSESIGWLARRWL